MSMRRLISSGMYKTDLDTVGNLLVARDRRVVLVGHAPFVDTELNGSAIPYVPFFGSFYIAASATYLASGLEHLEDLAVDALKMGGMHSSLDGVHYASVTFLLSVPCMGLCALPPIVGTCRALSYSWSFSATTTRISPSPVLQLVHTLV